MIIILDSTPLGLLSNPMSTSESIAASRWTVDLMAAGHRLVVPAIADYEVRRELLRAGKHKSVARLDAFNTARPDRYVPLTLTDGALRLAATLWAEARNAGTPTADPKELDCDVLIAAQALEAGWTLSEFIVATKNVGHLSRYVPADLWTEIRL